jgi:phage shock protein PspC (stress-responsive transcriptional regulator)
MTDDPDTPSSGEPQPGGEPAQDPPPAEGHSGQGGGPPRDDPPTEPTAQAPGAGPPPPRRFTRSRTDRVFAGVGGGLARQFGIDPLLARLGICVVILVTGGAGLLLYLAAWLLVPEEQLAPGEPPPPPRSRAATIAGVAALVVVAAILLPGGFFLGWAIVPFAIVALVGLAVWWLVTEVPTDRTPRAVLIGIMLGLGLLAVAFVLFLGGIIAVAGGGTAVVAGVVLAAGAVLVASAFFRPVRWLIVPALALGLGAGTAVAAGAQDVGSSTGERVYRPASADEVRGRYELGAGHLVVDLRNADLRDGQRVHVKVGIGRAEVLVPQDVCVASDLHAGVGAVDAFGADSGGVDVDREDGRRAPLGTPRVVISGDVGMGLASVAHEPGVFDGHWRHDGDDRTATANTACAQG